MATIPVLVQVNSLALGGTQLNAVDSAWALRELGYDSLLVGPRDSLPSQGPSLLDVARDRAVPVRPIDRPTTTLGGARELSRIAAEHGSRLVHTYGSWSIRPAYWGPCRLARRPLVMTVYEMEVHASVYRAPGLVIGTKYLEEELVRRHGPVRLISPPVDLERDDPDAVEVGGFLSAHGLERRHRRIVIVSRLDDENTRPVKGRGVELAIRAVEQMAEPDVDLVIVGTGSDEARLRLIGAEVNCSLGRAAVVFAGAQSDPRPAYACADVVIGMGGSAARGLAFAKPLVVVGEFGWSCAFRRDTAEGLFRNSFWSEERPKDPVRDLMAELRPLLGDAGERKALGEFGRAFACEHFGLRAMARRLAQVYEQAMGGYGRMDWLYDGRLEADWAFAWLARRLGRAVARPSEVHPRLVPAPRSLSADARG